MGIVKANLEAVRYLAARAVYEEDDTCKQLMSLLTYNRRSVGFTNLAIEPYYRDGNSPRALNIIADSIACRVGDDWYKVIMNEGCAEYILGVFLGNKADTLDKFVVGGIPTDKELLTYFRQREVIFATRKNIK